MPDDWIPALPGLNDIEPAARRRMVEAGRRVRLPAGVEPFRAGSPCESWVLVIAGSIRVQMLAESGREIVLYRVGAGETCILTTTCLLSGELYPASALTETEVDAAVLPQAVFRELLDGSAGFRDFVFHTWGRRLASVMALLEEVAFRRLDCRLAEWLLGRVHADGTRLRTTHQEIAVELGSAREVVSRLLKDFEHRGWVVLGRGAVTVTTPDALRAFLRSEVG